MTTTTILLCTVGGSHAPIVTAITHNQPHVVCFICTDKDPGTGKPGSRTQIEGQGNCIKARHEDQAPTLPNIPTQCGLEGHQWQLRIVPSDDLDGIYTVCREALQHLRQQYPQARIIADYTGGTKSMSAALVMAALEIQGVDVQLVTGNRANLRGVVDGAEAATPASIDAITIERSMQPHLAAWDRYAYAEAEAGLRALPNPRNPLLRTRLDKARQLSAAYAAWDRFDHQTAREILQTYAAVLPDSHKALIGTLTQLTSADPVKQEAARLLDLYRNAQRRYQQGRYDDAIARWYRLLEWTAQWQLKTACNLDTSDLPEHIAPDLTPSRDGKRQAGLFKAWQILAGQTQGPLTDWYQKEQNRMQGNIKARNHSILAHGSEPIARDLATDFHNWLEQDGFLDALLQATAIKSIGIRELPPQLPRQYNINPVA